MHARFSIVLTALFLTACASSYQGGGGGYQDNALQDYNEELRFREEINRLVQERDQLFEALNNGSYSQQEAVALYSQYESVQRELERLVREANSPGRR